MPTNFKTLVGVGSLESYRVNIQGLSTKIHQYDFSLNDEFFRKYGIGLVSEGNLTATVTLDKSDTLIDSEFKIRGTVALICDRSLDSFDHPTEIDEKIIFKFGHEDAEISEDVLVINHTTESLDLGQFMYEFISLSIPMKKLHPRFNQEDEQDEIVYTSEPGTEPGEIDPRWEILKKLNKK